MPKIKTWSLDGMSFRVVWRDNGTLLLTTWPSPAQQRYEQWKDRTLTEQLRTVAAISYVASMDLGNESKIRHAIDQLDEDALRVQTKEVHEEITDG